MGTDTRHIYILLSTAADDGFNVEETRRRFGGERFTTVGRTMPCTCAL